MEFKVYCKYKNDNTLYYIGTYNDINEALIKVDELYKKEQAEKVWIH